MGLLEKYSPRTFAEYVGERVRRKVLRKIKWRLATQIDVLGNADFIKRHDPMKILLVGAPGSGKTSCARLLGKAHFCTEGKDGGPCGVCETCVKFEGRYGRNDVYFNVPPSRTPSTKHLTDCYFRVFDFANITAAGVKLLLEEIGQPKDGLFFRSHPEVVVVDEAHRASLDMLSQLLTTLHGTLFSSVIFCATKKGRDKMDPGFVRRFDEVNITAEIGEVLSLAKTIVVKESIPTATESALVKLVSGLRCNPGFVIKALAEAQDDDVSIDNEWVVEVIKRYSVYFDEDQTLK